MYCAVPPKPRKPAPPRERRSTETPELRQMPVGPDARRHAWESGSIRAVLCPSLAQRAVLGGSARSDPAATVLPCSKKTRPPFPAIRPLTCTYSVAGAVVARARFGPATSGFMSPGRHRSTQSGTQRPTTRSADCAGGGPVIHTPILWPVRPNAKRCDGGAVGAAQRCRLDKSSKGYSATRD